MTGIPTTQVDRFLQGEPALLSFAPLDQDDEPLTVTEPATVTIVDGAGVAVVEDAEATVVEEEEAAPHLTYLLDPDDFALLDTYTVTWTAVVGEEDDELSWTTTLELCGGHLFRFAAFRALGASLKSAAAATIREARRLAEDRFEDECAVAFVPRGARARRYGDGSRTLILPHVALRGLYSVTLDEDTELTEAELAELEYGDDEVGGAIVRRPAGKVWPADTLVELHYAHGYDRPSRPVVAAVLELAREYAAPNTALPPRATSVATDLGVFRISTANAENPTGLPNVDAVIRDVRRKRPSVG